MSADARSLRYLERLAWLAAACLLGWWMLTVGHAWWYQHAAAARFANDVHSVATEITVPYVDPHAVALPETLETGATIGRLEVPRLGLSVMVAEGDSDDTLDVAAGHLPDTPLPWQPGNSALAAHRDTYFRRLKAIKADDEVRLTTAAGTFSYKVKQVSIVTPEDLSVLRETSQPTLTLITCYPFSYIGHAPKRFVVRAERSS